MRTNNQATVIAQAIKSAGIPVKTTRQPAEITAAISLAAQNTSRHALAAWASDTIEESLEDAERTVAGLVKQFLSDDQSGVVDGRAFAAWVTATANTQTVTPGVEILTFHGAKGREWDFVVVAGAESGLLPHSSAKTAQQKAEETRLAYVALTRAGHQLVVTWARSRNGRKSGKSELLNGLPLGSSTEVVATPTESSFALTRSVDGLRESLLNWRRIKAQALFISPSSFCSDEELRLVVERLPQSASEVAAIFGPMMAEKVVGDIITLVNNSSSTTARIQS